MSEQKKENVRKLLLIGNGFDLAHDIPTGYIDFLNWWIAKKENQYKMNSNELADDIIEIVRTNGVKRAETWTYRNIRNIIAPPHYKWKNRLLDLIIDQVNENKGWVDIEEIYYKDLLRITNAGIHNPVEKVEELNNHLSEITNLLVEYLNSEDVQSRIAGIDQIFHNTLENYTSEDMVVNFNYTNTIEGYYRFGSDKERQPEIVHIHGSLNSKYPIVFGYGDEIDKNYKDIQDKNEDEYLKKFKTFFYALSPYYHRLRSFIDDGSYEVEIIGLSCGLSDRVLLNTILDNEKCHSIKIRSRSKEGFQKVLYNISRHFKDPATFRHKVADFKDEFLIK